MPDDEFPRLAQAPPQYDPPFLALARLCRERAAHAEAARAALREARATECEILAVARSAALSGRLDLGAAYMTPDGVLVVTGTASEPQVILAPLAPGQRAS